MLMNKHSNLSKDPRFSTQRFFNISTKYEHDQYSSMARESIAAGIN